MFLDDNDIAIIWVDDFSKYNAVTRRNESKSTFCILNLLFLLKLTLTHAFCAEYKINGEPDQTSCIPDGKRDA